MCPEKDLRLIQRVFFHSRYSRGMLWIHQDPDRDNVLTKDKLSLCIYSEKGSST